VRRRNSRFLPFRDRADAIVIEFFEVLTTTAAISTRLLDGFDDPSIDKMVWRQLLGRSHTNTVFLTPWWQKTWWEVFQRGTLLLLGVFRGSELVCIAPFFSDAGMVFFVGSGGSDYLDFIGDAQDAGVLVELIEKATDLAPGFVGFRFFHVPDNSGTGLALQEAARRLGLKCFDEGELPAPTVDLTLTGDGVAKKKSLLRHQRFFEREGKLVVRHFSSPGDIIPRLEHFFEQHIARWTATPYPSLFLDPAQRRFYRELAESASGHSWLRFTEVNWNGNPIAFHFGFHFRQSYMWYKPAFDINLAKRSPGEVLIRSLLLAAIEEGASTFDLGLGAEAFKQRFATETRIVRTWGLYPADRPDKHKTISEL
jgi:CelD/BcsL family acetyltransferase involved in cellulose biosynthesis